MCRATTLAKTTQNRQKARSHTIDRCAPARASKCLGVIPLLSLLLCGGTPQEPQIYAAGVGPLGLSPTSQRSGASVRDVQQTGKAEALKRFVSIPPVAIELVAEVSKPRQTETGMEITTRFVMLRYQTNAFLYREAGHPLQLSTASVLPGYWLGGRYEDEFWYLSQDGRTLSFATNLGTSVEITPDYLTRKASLLLNLGVFDSPVGTLIWDGTRLSAFTNHSGVVIAGELMVGPDGSPRGLQLATELNGDKVRWEIGYDFAPSQSRPPFFPSRIAGSSIHAFGRVTNFEVRVLAAKLSDTPFPKDAFARDAFTKHVTFEVLSTPSGKFVRDRLNKRFEPVSRADDSGSKSRHRTVVLLAVGSVTIALLLLGRGRKGFARTTG
jgi:hypothetical protein